ncbi:MAG TPA: hypothetical protein VH593_29445 [Ktedonobacteraceae bacterium]
MIHSCPLCGDTNWEGDQHCRRVEAARDKGTLHPRCGKCATTEGVAEYVHGSGYFTAWLCPDCHDRTVEAEHWESWDR